MQSSASAVQLLEFILRVKQLLLQYPPAAGTWHLLLPQLRQHQPQRCVPEVLSLKSAISCHYDVQIPLVLLHFCTQTIFLGGFDVQADDDDLDLFGEETEEEAAAAAEREASKKAAGAKKKESKSFFFSLLIFILGSLCTVLCCEFFVLERCAFRAHIAFWINGWQSLPESQKKAVFFSFMLTLEPSGDSL
jgi:hypothetical protein